MSEVLRVLYATAEPHPSFRPDVAVLFGKALPEQGVCADLVAIGDTDGEQAWGGGKAFVRAGRGKLGAMIADLRQQLSLFRRCRSAPYRALIVRDKPILGLIGFLAAWRAGISFAYWMSYPMPESYLELSRNTNFSRGRRLYCWLRGTLGGLILHGLLIHRADWIFAQSDYMIRTLRQLGMKHDRVSAVPMGIDLQAVRQCQAESHQKVAAAIADRYAGRPLAVYLGTLDRLRHPEVLIDGARLAAASIPGFMLLVIGEADEPSERGWLKQYAEQTGAADSVHFCGRMPQLDALALTARANVGLSFYRPTPLFLVASPTKAVECLALGLPVIANRIPDQEYVLNQSGGGWCVEFDPKQMADALHACLTDLPESRRKAEVGRRWVEQNRSYTRIATNVAADLRAIAGSRGVAIGSARRA